jgi:hypothetical protein
LVEHITALAAQSGNVMSIHSCQPRHAELKWEK